MGNILLEPITTSNEATCLALRLSTDQQPLIASNERSLAQAHDNIGLNPLGIMLNETMVGFTMWEPRTRQVASIHRLMIDHLYQRRGYGKQSMIVLLEEIAALGHTTTYLSFRPENNGARMLYESIGFIFQEEEADGELLYRLGSKASLGLAQQVAEP